MREKIALAFSGGVDSTIAAFKLSQEGYEVHAVYLDLWKWKIEEGIVSNHDAVEDKFKDLRQISDANFSKVDASDIMRNVVVDDFLEQLGAGNTPSPCIRCNPLVKFHLMLEYANQHSIENIATGHYAQIIKNKDGSYSLKRARDLSKDQTYMLCYLDQVILSRTIFPLGETTKTENRLLAQELGLSVSEQAESQDLCFLNNNTYHDFVKHFSPEILIPGNIVDTEGNLLGTHNGLALYTIGQRKGIKVASKEPYYVVEKDMVNNRLIVGYLSELGKQQMLVEKVNWISGKEIENIICDVKIRYRSKLYEGSISKQKGERNYLVQFKEKLRDITPGQYAVFYENERVLGGGMITKAL